jgi:AcrR family transcriptional regulator
MRSTTRKPTAQRREEIARAVLRIIGERGLTSLTTATLATEVGVTTGALYRHFASLDEILSETARYGVDKIEATFPDPALPPLERLLALARNRVRLLGGDAGLAWLLRSEQAYLTLPKDAAGRLRDVARRSRRFLLQALREGAEGGSIRDDIEPEFLLVPVLATIHAVIGMRGAHHELSRREQRNPERVLSALVRLLEPPPGAPGSGSRPSSSNGQKPSGRRLQDEHQSR